MRHTSILGTFALVAALAGCGGDGPVAPTLPAGELRAAPTLVMVSGRALRLATYLWRDFQPISPPDGKPLVGVLQVRAADDGSIPAGTRVDAAWVVFGDQVWSAPIREDRGIQADGHYQVVIGDGPKWGPGVTVDVVVRVRDPQGEARLLRAPDQPIHRTD